MATNHRERCFADIIDHEYMVKESGLSYDIRHGMDVRNFKWHNCNEREGERFSRENTGIILC